ncbi:ester cyclase [Thalassotalea sediminis]|uniref:ester cyclase n=1 Tax=Thalassotalea sediminis TaxID=1759089 RepID=UPI002574463A|nr:ester cyclase [Thalassotalea sediminis]
MNKETLINFIQDVWNEGKIDTIGNYIADSYTIYHDPGDPWHTKTLNVKEFQQRVSTSRAPFPDQLFDIQTIFEAQSRVCITWLWQGTQQQEIAGILAKGKTFQMSGATVYSFDNKRICGHWQVADRLSIYQQLQQYRLDN